MGMRMTPAFSVIARAATKLINVIPARRELVMSLKPVRDPRTVETRGVALVVPLAWIDLMLVGGLFGTGFGLFFGSTSILIVDAVPAHRQGISAGMLGVAQGVSTAVGLAISTAFLNANSVSSQVGIAGIPAGGGALPHLFRLRVSPRLRRSSGRCPHRRGPVRLPALRPDSFDRRRGRVTCGQSPAVALSRRAAKRATGGQRLNPDLGSWRP